MATKTIKGKIFFAKKFTIKKSLYFLLNRKAKELNTTKSTLLNLFIRHCLDRAEEIYKSELDKEFMCKKNYCERLTIKYNKDLNDELTEFCKMKEITKTEYFLKLIDEILQDKYDVKYYRDRENKAHTIKNYNGRVTSGITILVDKDKYNALLKYLDNKNIDKIRLNKIIREIMYDNIKQSKQ